MSAYIVPKEHIDALVRAGLDAGRNGSPLRWYHNNEGHALRYDNATEVGKMLWAENVKSLNKRYPDTQESLSGYPGPSDFTPFSVDLYRFEGYANGSVVPEKALKALHGYEYQTCEHDGWEGSEAYRFVRSLERALISKLPAYDRADTWSVDDVSQIMGGRTAGMELG